MLLLKSLCLRNKVRRLVVGLCFKSLGAIRCFLLPLHLYRYFTLLDEDVLLDKFVQLAHFSVFLVFLLRNMSFYERLAGLLQVF